MVYCHIPLADWAIKVPLLKHTTYTHTHSRWRSPFLVRGPCSYSALFKNNATASGQPSDHAKHTRHSRKATDAAQELGRHTQNSMQKRLLARTAGQENGLRYVHCSRLGGCITLGVVTEKLLCTACLLPCWA